MVLYSERYSVEKMKKLLLITGDIAAGKSTFAKILSKRYQVIALCKDSLKEVLGDTIGFSNRQENKKLSEATMGLMAFIFSEFAKLGNDLILEANFHEHELEKLHQIAAESKYGIFFDLRKILSIKNSVRKIWNQIAM